MDRRIAGLAGVAVAMGVAWWVMTPADVAPTARPERAVADRPALPPIRPEAPEAPAPTGFAFTPLPMLDPAAPSTPAATSLREIDAAFRTYVARWAEARPSDVEGAVNARTADMQALRARYEAVADLGEPVFAGRAWLRTGELEEELGRWLDGLRPPGNVPEATAAAYRARLAPLGEGCRQRADAAYLRALEALPEDDPVRPALLARLAAFGH